MRRGIISDRYSRGYQTLLSGCGGTRPGSVRIVSGARIYPKFLITMNYTCRETLLALERRIREVYRLNKLACIVTVCLSWQSVRLSCLRKESWFSEKKNCSSV